MDREFERLQRTAKPWRFLTFVGIGLLVAGLFGWVDATQSKASFPALAVRFEETSRLYVALVVVGICLIVLGRLGIWRNDRSQQAAKWQR